ncbi:MAG: nlpD [Gammaproteobacteria bacterium]|jgi:lipoprotein NlpD|nr:nlpD [Gammaproteobacteria bacterium]
MSLIMLAINACNSRTDYAPINNINTIDPLPKNGIYHVSHSETLYSIAWRYGLDYRDLAMRNHLMKPYAVHPGQLIYLTKTRLPPVNAPDTHKHSQLPQQSVALGHAILQPRSAKNHNENPVVSTWNWPARGRIVNAFSSNNKGINIGGYVGNPIFATAAGKIVYSGNGLHGYGNLIIVKHNNQFLSAYAHNRKILVKEGDWVEKGQKIAEMGSIDSKHALLHFEIRRNGQPVNPLFYLTAKT